MGLPPTSQAAFGRGNADHGAGIQMFWGGQAVRIVLGSVIGPKFVNMANTLPSSANVETADLVCFFIFVIILGSVKTISMIFLRWLILA
jgi:cytosine/uracil/thiamine/allantoin permease